MLLSASPDRHSLIEDAFALVVGTALVALSVQLLRSDALITGQIAGLSLVLSYASGYSFGLVFFVLNLPFYVFAILRMGWRFTLKTMAAVALLSGFTEGLSGWASFTFPHPVIAAVLSAFCAGTGLLILFRHGASLGGVGIMALYLQDKLGIKAGYVQLAFDALVFVLALFLFDWQTVLWSLIGSLVLNMTITMNHRRDRYIAS